MRTELSPETIHRAQQGEPDAQRDVLRRYAGPVRSLVRRMASAEDVEDQLQECLAKLLEVLPRFRMDGPAHLTTWVFSVVHRQLLMHRRKARLMLVPLSVEDEMTVADPREDVEAKVAASRLRARLEAAISELSEDHRRVFVLTQLHQLPLEEVARNEQLALGTVKSRLHRAKAELVLKLGPVLDLAVKKGADRAGGK